MLNITNQKFFIERLYSMQDDEIARYDKKNEWINTTKNNPLWSSFENIMTLPFSSEKYDGIKKWMEKFREGYPRYVYKFIPLSQIWDESTFGTLRKGFLWFSSYEKLKGVNDQREFQVLDNNIDFDSDLEKALYYETQIFTAGLDGTKITLKKMASDLKCNISELEMYWQKTLGEIKEVFKKYRKCIHSNIYTYCLTETMSERFWMEYANNKNGICLRFRLSSIGYNHLHKVEYLKSYISSNHSLSLFEELVRDLVEIERLKKKKSIQENWDKYIVAAFTRKYRNTEYVTKDYEFEGKEFWRENEYRMLMFNDILSETSGVQGISLSEAECGMRLDAIYIGEKCSANDMNTIREIIKDRKEDICIIKPPYPSYALMTYGNLNDNE